MPRINSINEPFKILFWNVKAENSTEKNRKKIRFLQEIAVKEQPDVICLCKHRFITQRVEVVFSESEYLTKEKYKFFMAVRLKNFDFKQDSYFPFGEHDRLSRLKILENKFIYFCHLPDMGVHTDSERFSFAQEIINITSYDLFEVSRYNKVGLGYVILGDFNMFPYENGMQDTLAFNSYSTLEHETYFTSKFQGIERTKYYNPFWSLYGNEERIYDPTRKITRLTPKKEQPRYGGTFKGKDTRKQFVLDQALIPIYALDQYQGCKVFHEGFNFSDHAPIMLEMNW